MRRLLIVFATSAIAACGGSSPSPPVVTPPPSAETINGSERIGWDQPAADAVELAAIRYAIYVDGTRTEAAGVSCATTATATGFACSARLPSLTPGAHSLQIASFVNDGGMLESARSAALPVNVVATSAAAEMSIGAVANPRAIAPRSAGALSSPDTAHSTASDSAGAEHLELVADGLIDPTDLALAPDGRMFIAERRGTVRVVDAAPTVAAARVGQPDRVLAHDRSALLAIAIDPEFLRTRFVFAIHTEAGVDGSATFALARVREAGGTLADAVVLLDGIPASASPRAALRFGADHLLYAAFDAGGEPRLSADPASLNGKVLRLNGDGTTPRDQPVATPAIAGGLFAPAGLASIAGAQQVWAVDARADGSAQLLEVRGNNQIYRLPEGVTPASMVATPSGDLLIASAGEGTLLRVRFDRAISRPVATERMSIGETDQIHALTIAPDGALYIATSSRLWRLEY